MLFEKVKWKITMSFGNAAPGALLPEWPCGQGLGSRSRRHPLPGARCHGAGKGRCSKNWLFPRIEKTKSPRFSLGKSAGASGFSSCLLRMSNYGLRIKKQDSVLLNLHLRFCVEDPLPSVSPAKPTDRWPAAPSWARAALPARQPRGLRSLRDGGSVRRPGTRAS